MFMMFITFIAIDFENSAIQFVKGNALKIIQIGFGYFVVDITEKVPVVLGTFTLEYGSEVTSPHRWLGGFRVIVDHSWSR